LWRFSRYFSPGFPSPTIINILNKKGELVKELRKGDLGIKSASEEEVDEGLYNIEVIPENNPVKKIKFNDFNISQEIDLGIDDVPESKVEEKNNLKQKMMSGAKQSTKERL